MKLNILSWNIWCDGDIGKVDEFLKKSNADIIGLQEVLRKDGKISIFSSLIKELGYKYVYVPTMQIEKDGQMVDIGNAIFSKYEIIGTTTHVLSQTDSRLAIEANIRIDETVLNVFTTHLLHTHQQPSEVQDLQVKNLISILPHEYIILMGDFNAIPQSKAIKKISAFLKNTDTNQTPTWSMYPEGCKVCMPQGLLYKLDYIFVGTDITTRSYKVENSKGSDHLPICATIEV